MVQIRRWIGRNGPQEDEIDCSKISVGQLKSQTASTTSSMADNLDVIFCGQKLRDDMIFENCAGFNEKSIIFVVDKPKTDSNMAGALPSMDEKESLLTSLHTTLQDPHHRGVLSRIILSGDTLQNLIDVVPGLRQDTVAQGILKDPYLLFHWVNDDKVLDLFGKHPCLYEACQYIMNCLHAEVVRHSGMGLDAPMMPPPPPGVAVGDPFASDDEDDEDEDGQQQQEMAGHAGMARRSGAGGGGNMQITPQQLAAALAMASGSAPPSTSRSTAPGANRQASAAGASGGAPAAAAAPLITPDMFQLAMQQALAATAGQQQSQQTHQQAQQSQMRDQLQQLRDMGFLNEQENARALQVSNGDVMAAIEFIISERERQEQGFGLD